MEVGMGSSGIKSILFLSMTVVVILMLSDPSLAGMVDGIRDRLDEHGILIPLGETDNTEKKGSIDDGGSLESAGISPSSGSSGIISASDNGQSTDLVPPGEHPSDVPGVESMSERFLEPDLYSDLERHVLYYNNGINDVPGVVKKLAGNDVILLDIHMDDNSQLKIKAVTEDGPIVEFRKLSAGEKIDPTVTVIGKEPTIRELLKNEDPLGYFISSLNTGSVDVSCRGFLKNAALSAFKALG